MLKTNILKVFAKKSRAFTLIELLVVVAVIGLLASIILVSMGPARAKARDAKRQEDMKQINLAMELCYSEATCGPGEAKYPIHTCAPSYPCANNWTKIDNADGVPLLLGVFPADPKNSGSYVYTWIASAEQWYCIYTKLEAPAAATWECASNKGVASKAYAGPPTRDDCCGKDVD